MLQNCWRTIQKIVKKKSKMNSNLQAIIFFFKLKKCSHTTKFYVFIFQQIISICKTYNLHTMWSTAIKTKTLNCKHVGNIQS